jgi:hypothetical protein
MTVFFINEQILANTITTTPVSCIFFFDKEFPVYSATSIINFDMTTTFCSSVVLLDGSGNQ